MKTRTFVVVLLTVIAVGMGIPRNVAAGNASIRLVNNMPNETALGLFVDDEATPRCQAPWQGTCDTLVTSGEHFVQFRRVSDGYICEDIGPIMFRYQTAFSYDKPCSPRPEGSMDVTFVNGMGKKTTLRFFVDREPEPRCELASQGTCPSTLTCGKHRITAKKTGETKACAILTLMDDCVPGMPTKLLVDTCAPPTEIWPILKDEPLVTNEFLTNEVRLFNDTTQDGVLALFIDKEPQARCTAAPGESCATKVTVRKKAYGPLQNLESLINHTLTAKRISDGVVCKAFHHDVVQEDEEVRATACTDKGVKLSSPKLDKMLK